LGLFVALCAISLPAHATPEAHILRIDPRSSQVEGAPILTTVVEIVQNKPLNGVTGPCSAMPGNDELDCIANGMEKPKALWEAIGWPEGNTFMTIKVENGDLPMKFISKVKWGESQKDTGVGTAFLIMIDAGSSMGARFEEAKGVAKAFVSSLRENDIVNIMFFNDRSVVYSSQWTKDKAKAQGFVDGTVTKAFTSTGRTRPLGQILQNGATDGFKELGNVGQHAKVPMHQAMVVLSSGAAGQDASSVGLTSKILVQYLTKGRFPEDNLALPKMPVPVVSVWFPSKALEELFENARQFMENLANTEIGGYYSIVRESGEARGDRIVKAVRARFDNMWIVKWQVSCVAPTVQQTFNLVFKNTELPIGGDGSYQNVPVGIDPTAWPLDIDVTRTEDEAKKNPLYPGGKVTVYGNFCWGGKKERAELYLLPKQQEVPTTLEGGTIDEAKNAQKTLIDQGLRGTVLDANDDFVTFELPDKEKFLTGKNENFTARIVVHDNLTKRTSAVTKEKIITLKAQPKPLPYLLIGGIAFGGVVLILLLVAAFRSGGKKRGGGSGGAAAPPPRPVVGAPGPAPMPMNMPMAAPQPMPMNMMGGPGPGPAPAGPAFVQRATLSGASGIFTVLPGIEMKAGRDGALCQILLTEPRVSGTHASMKIDNGQLFARDDNSNNGTTINGQRLSAGVWTPVPNGASLRFGPIEFMVNLE